MQSRTLSAVRRYPNSNVLTIFPASEPPFLISIIPVITDSFRAIQHQAKLPGLTRFALFWFAKAKSQHFAITIR